MNSGILRRVGESAREELIIYVNGTPTACLAGDTLLTALLLNGGSLRCSEFGDGLRAGFCNMGACQDCWVTLEGGRRVRACTTFIEKSMRVLI